MHRHPPAHLLPRPIHVLERRLPPVLDAAAATEFRDWGAAAGCDFGVLGVAFEGGGAELRGCPEGLCPEGQVDLTSRRLYCCLYFRYLCCLINILTANHIPLPLPLPHPLPHTARPARDLHGPRPHLRLPRADRPALRGRDAGDVLGGGMVARTIPAYYGQIMGRVECRMGRAERAAVGSVLAAGVEVGKGRSVVEERREDKCGRRR